MSLIATHSLRNNKNFEAKIVYNYYETIMICLKMLIMRPDLYNTYTNENIFHQSQLS